MDLSKKVVAGAVTALVVVVVVVTVAATWDYGPTPDRTWLNGDYKVGDINLAIVHVDDEGATFHQLKFLDSEAYAVQPMSWVGGCCSAQQNRCRLQFFMSLYFPPGRP